jgi:chaperone modulatory protein CbpM
MTSPDNDMLTGAIFEETAVLTVSDLCRLCAVEERRIVEFVEEGVLEVTETRAAEVLEMTESGAAEWQFTGSALRRTRMALRLERDFELSLAGVALVMDLMEELEQLRRELSMRR